MKTGWQSFGSRLPTLGQVIQIRADGKVTDLGKIRVMEDLGGGWTSLTTDKYVNCAVASDYEWQDKVA